MGATVHIVTLPGWLFPAEVFAPVVQAIGRVACWTPLSWGMALSPDGLRTAVASKPAPCILLAWSLGALPALRLAADPVPGLNAMVLLGATARLPADPATGYPGVDPAVLLAMRRRLRRDPAGLFRDFHALCQRPDAATPSTTEPFVQAALAQEREIVDAGLAALATLDMRSLAAAIALPVTLIHGAADDVVPVGQAQALAAALPKGRLVMVPSSGHALGSDLCAAAVEAVARCAADAANGGG